MPVATTIPLDGFYKSLLAGRCKGYIHDKIYMKIQGINRDRKISRGLNLTNRFIHHIGSYPSGCRFPGARRHNMTPLSSGHDNAGPITGRSHATM